MKYVEFIKDHPAGIKAGKVAQVSDNEAKRYIKEKFAKESSEDDHKSYLEAFTGNIGAGAKEATDAQKENSKAVRLRINGKPRANAKPKKPIGKKDDGKELTPTEKEFFKTRNEARKKVADAQKGLIAKANGENTEEDDGKDISTKLTEDAAIERILVMESVKEINAFLEGEARTAVVLAAKDKVIEFPTAEDIKAEELKGLAEIHDASLEVVISSEEVVNIAEEALKQHPEDKELKKALEDGKLLLTQAEGKAKDAESALEKAKEGQDKGWLASLFSNK